MSWSSGKDATFALEQVQQEGAVDVVGLMTTVNAEADRVTTHAVRRDLVETQADRLDLPLHVVDLPWPCPNDVYEERVAAALETAREEGVEGVVFGDLHLADVRAYREALMRRCGMEPLFPLWGRPTDELAAAMLASGIEATLACVDLSRLPAGFAGRAWDIDLLVELPESVDPCGEHGEFHTFVSDGPGFRSAVRVEAGEVVQRDGFAFRDLRPARRGGSA